VRFDVLIVGCGAAGAVLAARLSERGGRSVCVVEAGEDYPSIAALPPAIRSHRSARGLATSLNDPAKLGFPDWGLTARSTALQPASPLPRGKVVGGSSSVNGGVFLHALREDLDGWALNNPLWSFEACRPFFKRLETDCDFPTANHGADGPVPVHRAPPHAWVPLNEAFYAACRDLGFADCPDFNEPDAWGVGPLPVNHDHVRYSSAVAYLMPARARPDLTILANAHALRLLRDGTSVRGVECAIAGDVRAIEADEIVLAAGAVGSPHLLMLSGIGPADHRRSIGIDAIVNLPGVGQNLLDHPVLCASWEASAVQLPTMGPGMPGQLGLRATTPGSGDVTDMRLVSFRAEGDHRFGIPFSLMHARSIGRLELASADPCAVPRVDFRHLEDPEDLARMRAMLEVVTTVVEHPAYDDLRGPRVAPLWTSHSELDEWMLRTVITGHHISGTCKMGPDTEPLAVVDQTGRVHGVSNLRVVDASIMPDCPRVNINATTMMLAERMSALMA
jgi:choline dehydrogenase